MLRPFIAVLVFVLADPAKAISQELSITSTTTGSVLTIDSEQVEYPDVLSSVAGVDIERMPLGEALNYLHKHASVPLIFSPTLLPDRVVECRCNRVSVGTALTHLLRDTGLNFTVHHGQIVIAVTRPDGSRPSLAQRARSAIVGASRTEEESMLEQLARRSQIGTAVGLAVALAAGSGGPLSAQTGAISGRVIDGRTQQPLAAVSVTIEALGMGALTQSNGQFTIATVPSGTHSVSANRLGYGASTQVVTVGSEEVARANFDLFEQAIGLDAIVVTGTPGGTQVRAIGNVVDRVDVAPMKAVGATQTMEQLLSSRVPGLNMMSGHSATVGVDAGLIRIRGSSSPSLSGGPIVYVDGVRINSSRWQPGAASLQGDAPMVSGINAINPADIESIEVIKGPAAATLYGSEASNGVIAIITKKGVSGDASFDVSVGYGGTWMANPAREIGLNWGVNAAGEVFSVNMYDSEIARTGQEPFSMGPSREANLSVRGGTTLFNYFISTNYTDRTGIVPYNWSKDLSGRIALSASLTEQLDASLAGQYTSGHVRLPQDFWEAAFHGNPTNRGYSDGAAPALNEGFFGRPWIENGDWREQFLDTDRFIWSGELVHNPTSWLRTRLSGGSDISYQSRESLTFFDETRSVDGSKSINQLETRTHTLDLSTTARIDRLVAELGSATSAGVQYTSQDAVELTLSGNDFALPSLQTIGATGGTRNANEQFTESISLGVYVQQEFDWANRMFLTTALRADDNSAFGDQFDIAIYPKVSATWVLNEEPFWRWDVVEQFRIRGAWGAAGTQPSAFAATRQYRTKAGPGDQSMVTAASYGNPDLGPERGQELELGFDAGFWQDRIALSFTHYWKTTEDAIISLTNTPSLGFPGTVFRNAGEIKNWGTETSLDLQLLRRDALRFDLGLGLATMHSKVVDLGGIDRLYLGRTRQHVEGYPLAGYFHMRVLSAEFLNGNSGPIDTATALCDGGTGADGNLMGGPPVPCLEAPDVYFGRAAEPTWMVNINPSLSVMENLRFTANIYAHGGNFVNNDMYAVRSSTWNNARSSHILDDPILQAYRQFRREAIGLYKGGFSRLREVAVQYNLPSAFAARVGATSGSLTLAGRNLALLWNESGRMNYLGNTEINDPEKTHANHTQRNEFDGIGEPLVGSMSPLQSFLVTARFAF